MVPVKYPRMISAMDPFLFPEAIKGNSETYTVSAFNESVKALLKTAYPQSIWISGEIQDFDRNRHRENIYFNLVEHEGGSDRIKSKVSVVIWGDSREIIFSQFQSASHDFELKDGLQVRFLCQVSFFVRSGSFILYVREVDPTFTLGKLMQAREQVLLELAQAGLLEQNKQLPFPRVPLRVGLITAKGSAAYHDFLNELSLSKFPFQVKHLHCYVQGELVAPTVTRALHYFEVSDEVDVVVLIRGGGSRSDLIWFDNKAIALAIAHHTKPVLTGIGHEIDRSVADYVSYEAFKTPTAVARSLIDRVLLFQQTLGEAQRDLSTAANRYLRETQERLRTLRTELRTHAHYFLREERTKLAGFPPSLRVAAVKRLQEAKRTLQLTRTPLHVQSQLLVKMAKERLTYFIPLLRQESLRCLGQQRETLAGFETQLRLLDPVKVLARGYSITRTRAGKAVTEIAGLKVEDELETTLAHGVVLSRISQIKGV